VPVRVPPDEVGGRRVESDEPSVGRERRAGAVAVTLYTAGPDADALGEAEPAVADEDVGRAVGVAGYEVGRVRGERHEAAVGRDRRPVARPVGLCAGGGDADPLGPAGPAVTDEDVLGAVGVAWH